MSLVFHCPHCQHLKEDPFEVLDQNVIDWMKCEACEKRFYFAIVECHRCAFENVYCWPAEPPSETLALLTCPKCQSTYLRNENSDLEEPGII